MGKTTSPITPMAMPRKASLATLRINPETTMNSPRPMRSVGQLSANQSIDRSEYLGRTGARRNHFEERVADPTRSQSSSMRMIRSLCWMALMAQFTMDSGSSQGVGTTDRRSPERSCSASAKTSVVEPSAKLTETSAR